MSIPLGDYVFLPLGDNLLVPLTVGTGDSRGGNLNRTIDIWSRAFDVRRNRWMRHGRL